jgi:hypothetical protein
VTQDIVGEKSRSVSEKVFSKVDSA